MRKLKSGHECLCAFLQFDSIGSQLLPGSKVTRQHLFDELETFLTQRISMFGGCKWSFGLDGGLYGFLVDDEAVSLYRRVALAGIDVVGGLEVFNLLHGSLLRLRISSTTGLALLNKDTAKILSEKMSAFMKEERKFGGADSFTITKEIYNELDDLQGLFKRSKQIQYKQRGEDMRTTLFAYTSRSREGSSEDISVPRVPKGAGSAGDVGDVQGVQCVNELSAPKSIRGNGKSTVVAFSPLTFRDAYRTGGGWKSRPEVGTYSDYVGVRGLMQAFGMMSKVNTTPELLNPDDFDDSVIKQPMNLVTVASPKANRWTGILMNDFFQNRVPKWEFKPDPDSKRIWNPDVILRMDGKEYIPTCGTQGRNRVAFDFGIVIRGPNPYDSSCMWLCIAGRSALGTAAACYAVTEPSCAHQLAQALENAKIKLADHRLGFCATVSMEGRELTAQVRTFRVEGIVAYPPV